MANRNQKYMRALIKKSKAKAGYGQSRAKDALVRAEKIRKLSIEIATQPFAMTGPQRADIAGYYRR